jgi:NAD(P)-dependent dehydrogenase (short-subunit alcohol dehydrogenase family)
VTAQAGHRARLASKVVVVTGGGTGIGPAVASRVVSEGAAVVIGGRRTEVGEQAAADLRGAGAALRSMPPG